MVAFFSFAGLVLLFLASNTAASTRANSSDVPRPLGVPATEYWDGDDGQWSSFALSVGTPNQTIRVLPANSQPIPWVNDAYYACQNERQNPSCTGDRGGVYRNSTSSTWSYENLHVLLDPLGSLESWLGYSGNGYFGNETIGVGWTGSQTMVIDHQMIAVTAGVPFYLGTLGIFPRPLNLSNWGDVQPSMMQNLFDRRIIPSLSWGYTASSSTHEPPALGSLTLGGYDQTRLEENHLSWPFGPDQSRDLLVWIRSIQTTSVVASSQADPSLSDSSSAFQAAIDFTVSYLWLPVAVCKKFEAAFGLVYDDTSQFYLLNDTQHEALLAANPNVTFTIGSDSFKQTVDIVMPYSHFDLTIKPPLVANQSLYFPLKRAVTNNQTVLGRVFMQSAYVIADYSPGRQNFSVAQARFPSTTGANAKLVAILPPGDGTVQNKTSLTVGAIVGIAVGAVGAIAIVGVGVWMVYRRRRTQKPVAAKEDDVYQDKPELEATEIDHTKGKHEADGFGAAITEMDGHVPLNELMEGKDPKVFEMGHEQQVIYEMPAEDVMLPELESNSAGTPLQPLSGVEDHAEEDKAPNRERFSYEE